LAQELTYFPLGKTLSNLKKMRKEKKKNEKREGKKLAY
jgi:hypothetical protein